MNNKQHQSAPDPRPRKKINPRVRKALLSTLMIVISIAIVGIVIYITLKDDMPYSIWDFFAALPTFFPQWPYLIAALGLMTLVIIANALKFNLLIHEINGRWYWKDSLKLHILGKYYDSISPFSTAGEPFQILHLRRCHVSSGQATSIVILSFFVSRIAFLVVALIAMLSFYYIDIDPLVRTVAYVGIFTSTIGAVAWMPLTLFPSITRPFAKFVFKIIDKFPFKHKTKKKGHLVRGIKNYQEALRGYKDNKLLILILFIMSLIGQAALASIPYFVIKAIPETALITTNIDFGEVVAACLYATGFANVMPTPGGTGGAEFSFATIFSTYVTGSHLTWSMLIWRIFTFYGYVIIGLVIVVVSTILSHRKKKQKVLNAPRYLTYQFADNYFPSVDGVVKAVHNYAINLNRLNHPTKVVAPFYRKADDQQLPYQVLRQPSYVLNFSQYEVAKPWLHHKLEKEVAATAPALIHAHSPFFIGHQGLKIAVKHSLPIVATFHSKYYEDFMQATRSKFLSKIALMHIVNFYKAVDEVWTVSYHAADVLQSYGYKGPIRVMANGTEFIKPTNIDQLIEEVRSKYKINNDKNNLLYVGALIWQKGIKKIIDTYVKLDDSYQLTIVGDGPHRKNIEQYAKKHGCFAKINWVGKIDDVTELQAVYAACDLLFFPSEYDTFSIVLREAAVMELPALVAANSACSEPIIDGQNGYIAEANAQALSTKINEIFADRSALKQAGEKAALTIPHSWHVIVDQVEKEYDRVIQTYYEKFQA